MAKRKDKLEDSKVGSADEGQEIDLTKDSVPPPADAADAEPKAEAEEPQPEDIAVVEADAKLAKYIAAFPLGGTFFLPGAQVGLTVAAEPIMHEGKVHALCHKHTGMVSLICIDGMLE